MGRQGHVSGQPWPGEPSALPAHRTLWMFCSSLLGMAPSLPSAWSAVLSGSAPLLFTEPLVSMLSAFDI